MESLGVGTRFLNPTHGIFVDHYAITDADCRKTLCSDEPANGKHGHAKRFGDLWEWH
jgi:hypothetical protein